MRHNYVKQSYPGAAKSGAGSPQDNITLHSTYFGLCDLGMGFPELGTVSLSELQSVRGRLGLGIERDLYFVGRYPLSVYAEAADTQGAITTIPTLLDAAAERIARRTNGRAP